MNINEIIGIITGVITAISTAATAFVSVYKSIKRKKQIKQDKDRLLDNLKNLYAALSEIKNYKIYLSDSDNVTTLAYYVLAYRNYLSYEECILLQRRIHEFEKINKASYASQLRPVVKKFLSDVKDMIGDRIK